MAEENKKIIVRDIIQIDDSFIEDIKSLIETKSSESLLNILMDLHPADISEIINHLNDEDALFVFNLFDPETAGEILLELDENIREIILQNTSTDKITDIVDELDTDDATDILSELPEEIAEEVLEGIDKEYSEDVKALLKYPEDSAGGIMNSFYIAIDENATVKDAIAEVRSNADEVDHIYQIYVVKDNGELVGVIPIKALLVNPLDTKVSDILDEDLYYVTANVDQEEVANIMHKYDLLSIPVVDENKIMLGRITIDDIVDVINEEAAEDIQKIAGLSEYEEYSYSAYRVSSIRLPWLLVALFGEMISASVLSSFQATIEQIYIAGIFIPIVMAMGGSSGTQSAIVIVRALATGDVWFGETRKRLFKEFKVAVLNGLACGLILLMATQIFWNNELKFSIILSASLIVIMINATMIGAVVPLILKRLKLDPAVSTGPFVTTANDIVGLIIYFSLITIFYVS